MTLSARRPAVVLYVEDHPANIRLVERILKRSYPEVQLVTATRGCRGLDLARALLPDLILLDLHLPGISGEEVLLSLRAGADTRAIPVVIISGDVSPQQVERLRDGATEYMTKPFAIPDFVAVVGSMIGSGGSR